jgi:hypothetical protein
MRFLPGLLLQVITFGLTFAYVIEKRASPSATDTEAHTKRESAEAPSAPVPCYKLLADAAQDVYDTSLYTPVAVLDIQKNYADEHYHFLSRPISASTITKGDEEVGLWLKTDASAIGQSSVFEFKYKASLAPYMTQTSMMLPLNKGDECQLNQNDLERIDTSTIRVYSKVESTSTGKKVAPQMQPCRRVHADSDANLRDFKKGPVIKANNKLSDVPYQVVEVKSSGNSASGKDNTEDDTVIYLKTDAQPSSDPAAPINVFRFNIPTNVYSVTPSTSFWLDGNEECQVPKEYVNRIDTASVQVFQRGA